MPPLVSAFLNWISLPIQIALGVALAPLLAALCRRLGLL